MVTDSSGFSKIDKDLTRFEGRLDSIQVSELQNGTLR